MERPVENLTFLLYVDNLYNDTEAPGDHQYLQDAAAYQRTGTQGQDCERASTRVVKDQHGHLTEVVYESQQSIEYPTTFLMHKPVYPAPMAYTYTKTAHQHGQ